MRRHKALFALACLSLVFPSCATAPRTTSVASAEGGESRTPASELAEDFQRESRFQELLNSGKMGERLQFLVDQISEAYFRAHSDVQAFDRILDEEIARGGTAESFQERLTQARVYSRLQTLRILGEEARHELSSLYLRLAESLEDDSKQGSPESLKAKEHLSDFARSLREAPPAVRVALKAWASETGHMEGRIPVEMLPAFKHLFVGDEEGFERFLTQPKVKSAVEKAVKKLNDSTTWIKRMLEDASSAPMSDIADWKGGRGLASGAVLQPDPGAAGNITGRTFPADTWAITYDDGPLPTSSSKILEILKANRMKATFFMLAHNASEFPEMAKKIDQTPGVEVANHSYTHAQLTKLNGASLKKEIVGANRRINEVLGRKEGKGIRFFRCPYGAGVNSPNIRKMIADEKLLHVFWNVDSLDWQDKVPTSVLARVQKQMSLSKGGVILFHDIHMTTVKATELFAKHFVDKGLRSVTMSEIVDELNAKAQRE